MALAFTCTLACGEKTKWTHGYLLLAIRLTSCCHRVAMLLGLIGTLKYGKAGMPSERRTDAQHATAGEPSRAFLPMILRLLFGLTYGLKGVAQCLNRTGKHVKEKVD